MARDINKALVLNMFRENELVSRAEIARVLKLSKVTVSTIVRDLIEKHFIQEQGMGNSFQSGGRKPILLSLDNSKLFVIGIDIGTTNIVAATANLKGRYKYFSRIPTAKSLAVEEVLDQVHSLAEEGIKQTGIGKKQIIAMGVSAAGIVDSLKGYIHFSPDFNWKSLPLRTLLEEHTNLPVVVDNCTRSMALGEQWYGSVSDARNVFYVNIGYGIGSALIINNRIYSNHSEFGHTFITKRKVLCNCGKLGCLEAVASGNAIERQANQLLNQHQEEWITAKELAERARSGDKQARQIFFNAGRYLGRAIAMATNLFNPEKIVIGGGVALAGDVLFKPLVAEFEKHTMAVIKKNVTVEKSTLGIDAGVMGAVALALNRYVFGSCLVTEVV